MRYHRINGEWVQVPEQRFTLGQKLIEQHRMINRPTPPVILTQKQKEAAHRKLEELQELIK